MLGLCCTGDCILFIPTDNCDILQGFGLIVGPSIPDLTDSLGYTYEEIVHCLALYNVGALVGSIIGGIFQDYFPQYSEIFMSMSCVISSIAGVFLPMAYPLSVMELCTFIMGLACNILNTGIVRSFTC